MFHYTYTHICIVSDIDDWVGTDMSCQVCGIIYFEFQFPIIVVYYESLKREVKTKPIYEFRCDERLQTKSEEFTRLTCTLLCAELEHLKIETR